MKKLLYSIFALSLLASASCSKDNNDGGSGDGGDGGDGGYAESSHVDVWTAVSGTTSADGDYVISVYDPATYDGGALNVTGSGTDVTNIVTSGMFSQGKYYYGGNITETGYGKYQVLENETIVISAQVPFQTYTYNYGGMTGSIAVTHAWLDDDTLICSQYNSTTQKHYWTKLDASGTTLKVLAEGDFDLHTPYNAIVDAADYNVDFPQVDSGGDVIADPATHADFNHDVYFFSTSGHMRYREADNTIIFVTTIHFKGAGTSGMSAEITNRGPLAIVTLDADDMSVKSTTVCDVVNGLALESYGDTCQERAMIDSETGDFYVIALAAEASGYYPPGTVTPSRSVLVRVKAGETSYDSSFGTAGALYPYGTDDLTVIAQLQDLGDGSAMVFMGKASDIAANSSYPNHYAVLDLSAGTFSEVTYSGSTLPRCSTNSFKNFIAKSGSKVYFAVTADASDVSNYDGTQIYSYDVDTKSVDVAFELESGITFDAIRVVENN